MEVENAIARAIVHSFYKVYNSLGYGFLEKVYENAIAFELRQSGLIVQQQAPVDVFYAGVVMGAYFADLMVNDCVIIELKAVEYLKDEHEAQVLNYLKATKINLGLLLNFGPKPQIKRKIFQTAR